MVETAEPGWGGEDRVVLQGVRKGFGPIVAVDGITAAIPRGCIYGFLGPNGAGKTTTLRMILDIIRPDEGTISVFGDRPGSKALERIGFLPEERGLYRKMRVGDVMSYFGRLKGMSKARVRGAIPRALEMVRLGGIEARRVEELSKGNQQKLQFASTLLHDPDLLILDEPFSGLDPVNLDLVAGLMLRLREEGKTLIFSTHVMDQAQKMCDSILLINKGKKVLDGPLDEVLSRHGANEVSLQCEGDLSFVASLPFVVSVAESRGGMDVTLEDGHHSQELLQALLGRVTVRGFSEKRPSLHEVFLRQVAESSPASSAEVAV